jgi:hypothetical protein
VITIGRNTHCARDPSRHFLIGIQLATENVDIANQRDVAPSLPRWIVPSSAAGRHAPLPAGPIATISMTGAAVASSAIPVASSATATLTTATAAPSIAAPTTAALAAALAIGVVHIDPFTDDFVLSTDDVQAT